jgi:hypothetical protein
LTEAFEQLVGALDVAAARERQGLELREAPVGRPARERLLHDVVGDQRLALLQVLVGHLDRGVRRLRGCVHGSSHPTKIGGYSLTYELTRRSESMSNVVPLQPPVPGLDDDAWDDLLNYIEERRVIPIVGPELLKVETPSGPRLLYDYMAEKARRPS